MSSDERSPGQLRFLSTLTIFASIILLLVFFLAPTSGIAIRNFKQRTGKNCSTETKFADIGCYCLLNGSNCLGNLKCINNVCACPSFGAFTVNKLGVCVNQNPISIPCLAGTTVYGWTDCAPAFQETNVKGLIVKFASIPQSCNVFVQNAFTQPNAAPASYTSYYGGALNDYLSVDAVTGQVYFNGGGTTPPAFACGPNAGTLTVATSQALIQTYVIQCIDQFGIASNLVTFNLTLPPCDQNYACNLDGTCCSTNPPAGYVVGKRK